MSEFDQRTLQNKLRQVQALLDRSEHPNTPPEEAASSKAMAERIMAKYRIEEEEARKGRMAQGLESIQPIMDEFPICDYNSQYRDHYINLMYQVTNHVGNIRMAYKYVNGQQVGYLVGFESDVKFAEVLYTSLRLHFANTLEPKYDPSLSLEENVYRMRNAGMERSAIGKAIWPAGRPKGVPEPSILYKRACEQRGENPKVAGRDVNVKTYRQSFADAYVSRISSRLYEMAAVEPGAAVQLCGRKDAVDEAFYERFPHLRPIRREDRQLGEGVRGGPLGNCPKCLKAKSGYCRDHNYLKPRSSYKDTPYSSLGASQGRSAANSADLGGRGNGNRIEGA